MNEILNFRFYVAVGLHSNRSQRTYSLHSFRSSTNRTHNEVWDFKEILPFSQCKMHVDTNFINKSVSGLMKSN